MEQHATQVGVANREDGLGVPLPELKVAQLVRSPEPVIKRNFNTELKLAESLIQPYGEYTLVIGGGFEEIQIFDKHGKRLEGLDNNDTIVVDWHTLRKDRYNNDVSKMVIDLSSNLYTYKSSYKPIDEFPPRLQPFIAKYIEVKGQNGNECDIPTKSWGLDTAKTGQIAIRGGKGYIIIRQQDSEVFVAFQTKSPQGVDLPPRNWKRFDNVEEWIGKLPPEIIVIFVFVLLMLVGLKKRYLTV